MALPLFATERLSLGDIIEVWFQKEWRSGIVVGTYFDFEGEHEERPGLHNVVRVNWLGAGESEGFHVGTETQIRLLERVSYTDVAGNGEAR